MRHVVATIALVVSIVLIAVAEASSSGIVGAVAALMSTTGLVQGCRRGCPLLSTGSFQLSGGHGRRNNGPD